MSNENAKILASALLAAAALAAAARAQPRWQLLQVGGGGSRCWPPPPSPRSPPPQPRWQLLQPAAQPRWQLLQVGGGGGSALLAAAALAAQPAAQPRWQLLQVGGGGSALLAAAALAAQPAAQPRWQLLQHGQFVSDVVLLSLSSAAGQLLIYRTIARFGAVAFTIIMTLRQAVSILLSCLVYGHSISFVGIVGVCIVFAAVFLRVYCRQRLRRRQRLP
ncbi:uncharacterized protein [Choristoneura fumiferana]|uniref:uncharacterized protein n=1 Tax=Choristoneura fumiferana TaxID=7141 RepID=UPI003D15692A